MFKSKYSAALEREITFLKEQLTVAAKRIEYLEDKVIELARPIIAAPSAQTSVAPVIRNGRTNGQPPIGNFLRSRSVLESASAAGVEIIERSPDKKEGEE